MAVVNMMIDDGDHHDGGGGGGEEDDDRRCTEMLTRGHASADLRR